MRIVLLGAPGSGKGTQAGLLMERYKVPHISTGDLLRAAVTEATDLGLQAKAAMDAGRLVSDEIVLGMLEARIRHPDTRRGFILDGFPRNIPQAQELDSRLGWMGRPLQIALFVDVSLDQLVKRLTGRMICGGCGAIYNRYFSPAKKKGVCDRCGGRDLKVRSDDNEATVRKRLETYRRETEPLTAYYRVQHKLRTVKADGDVDAIAGQIASIIDVEIRPLEVKVVDLANGEHEHEEVATAIIGGAVVKLDKHRSAALGTPNAAAPSVAGKSKPGTVTPVKAEKKKTAPRKTATDKKSPARKVAAKTTPRKTGSVSTTRHATAVGKAAHQNAAGKARPARARKTPRRKS